MKRFVITLALPALLASNAVADRGPSQVIENTVGITNLGSSRVNFFIKKRDGERTQYQLNPEERRMLECGDECIFYMKTRGKPPVQHRLIQTKRYAIIWDDSRRLWDIREVTE